MKTELTPEYVETLRRLSGVEKLKAASALYWAARRLKTAAVRQEHPEWTEEQILLRVNEIFLHAGA
jgi:hypothetical protein